MLKQLSLHLRCATSFTLVTKWL